MTSERRLTAVERSAKALDLRKGGVDYRTIARTLGYRSVSGAYDAVQGALKAMIAEPAAEVRALEVARLDVILRALWPAVLQREYAAIDRALRVMERRARLLGLDAPLKVNIDQIVRHVAKDLGLTEVETEETARDIESMLAGTFSAEVDG